MTTDSGADPTDAIHQPGALFSLPMSHEALEALPFPIAIYTRDGLLVAANALVEQLFRIPNVAVIGRFNMLTNPDTATESTRQDFLAAAAGRHVHMPATYYDFSFPGTQSSDQIGCWIEITYLPFHNAAGEVTHVGNIYQDVTEQIQAQQSTTLFSDLIENAGEGIGVADLNGRLTYCNAAYRAMTGYDDALLGMKLTDLYAEGDLELNAVIGQIERHGSWRGQLSTRHANGKTFSAELSTVILRDRNAQPSGIGIIMRDISDWLEREAELRIFKALVENAPVAIGVADADGTIIYANPAQQTLLGITQSMVGMSSFDFIVAEDHAMIKQMLARLPEERIGHFYARYQRKDGGIVPVAASVFLQEAPDGTQQVIGFVRDQSEQQRVETERAALQQQVIDAQQAALRELSTPLIPLADGVVAMPLIGSIDSSRSQMVIETLLTGVAEMRAHTTIIDITGVPVVDTQVANALLRAAQAIRLLGARVILTGIRPEVAQTLVGLGVDLSGISTRGTLQSGIVEALGQMVE